LTLGFRLKQDAPADLRQVKAHFESNAIETRPIIAGNLARHPAFARMVLREASSLAVCDDVLRNGFMIGCHPDVSSQMLARLRNAFQLLRNL
jgi:CDP-6-deoxy-D-xylo-4-hexulose-3-dehydrase